MSVCERVNVRDDRCRSCSEVHDSGKVTESDCETAETGVDRREAHEQNRWRDRGRHGVVGWGGGWGVREKKEREEGENKRCQFADERVGSQKAI